MKLNDFFDNQYSDLASYDNLRKIANYIDGLKNANRKVIWTVLKNKIYSLQKVQHLSAKSAGFTSYLHGSMDGVVVSLAKDYMGTNQVPLLKKKGNFGTRAIPEASASRYISACGSDILPLIFQEEVIEPQVFEGDKIEPQFLIPLLPVLLINGSRGVSFGFAQRIESRNYKELKNLIVEVLKGKKVDFNTLLPFYPNFKGTVKNVEQNKYLIEGVYTIKPKSSGKKSEIIISEIVPNVPLLKYVQDMDDLVEKGTLYNFIDNSSDTNAEFIAVVDSSQVQNGDISEALKKKLCLQETITENLTCIDENNKIRVFKDINEMVYSWLEVRKHYSALKKNKSLKDLTNTKHKLISMLFFTKNVAYGKINIKESTQESLIKIFDDNKLYKEDGKYEYLLRMPIISLTKERVEKLRETIHKTIAEIEELEKTSIEDLLITDITKL